MTEKHILETIIKAVREEGGLDVVTQFKYLLYDLSSK